MASAVLGTLVSLCVFLAYGTTASVARQVGAGREAHALAEGVAGLWLAAGIGLVVSAVTWPLAGRITGLFDPSREVADLAVTYLHVALLGAVPMLLMLAATGVLRGLQDTRTPLVVAVAGNLANIGLNLVLVYGVGSLAGSASPARPWAPCWRSSARPSRSCGSSCARPGEPARRCARTAPASRVPPGPACR